MSNLDVVRRSFEALHERDIDGLMACFSDDVVFDGSRIMEGVYEGKGRYRRFLESSIELVDFDHEDVSFLTEGERVIALTSVTGVGSESGIALGGRMAYLYELRGGLICRQEIHPDGEALLASLGFENV